MTSSEPDTPLSHEELRRAAEPEALQAAISEAETAGQTASHDHHAADSASVRRVIHRGHEIVIETRYTITVDGRPFDAHVAVDVDGRVHYHGLPTRDFASVVTMVEQAIDKFPSDFPPSGQPADDASEPHDHGHGGS